MHVVERQVSALSKARRSNDTQAVPLGSGRDLVSAGTEPVSA
jgi:hypothetical protein